MASDLQILTMNKKIKKAPKSSRSVTIPSFSCWLKSTTIATDISDDNQILVAMSTCSVIANSDTYLILDYPYYI